MSVSTPTLRPFPDCPLVVAYGLGVDSTAMLVEMANRSIRPDLILFADTGGEKHETYQYMHVIRPFLQKVGFPDVTVVRYQPKRAVYDTLEGQCLHTGTLPSLAYGGKTCSLKYKRGPQDKEIISRYPPAEMIKRRQRIVRAIGFGRRVVRVIGFDAQRLRRTYAQRGQGDRLDCGATGIQRRRVVVFLLKLYGSGRDPALSGQWRGTAVDGVGATLVAALAKHSAAEFVRAGRPQGPPLHRRPDASQSCQLRRGDPCGRPREASRAEFVGAGRPRGPPLQQWTLQCAQFTCRSLPTQ